MISFLDDLSIVGLVLVSIGVNVLLYVMSVVTYYALEKLSSHTTIQHARQAITLPDFFTSLQVLCCNAVVFLIGVLLWKHTIIVLRQEGNTVYCIAEVVILIIALDFLMYVFHRIAHLPLFYKLLHGKHHEHHATNAISLFVMHPFEAFSFGMLMIFVITVYPFSATAISVYIFINLLWGTIGHLSKEILPPGWSRMIKKTWLGTTLFHNLHHQDPDHNFGFYTTTWDRLFGTLKPINEL